MAASAAQQEKPEHHVAPGTLAELSARQRERLLRLGAGEEPFALITSNSPACAATLQAARDLGAFVVLLPNPGLLPLAAGHAKVGRVVGLEASGDLVVLEEGEKRSHQDRPWLSSGRLRPAEAPSSPSGACLICTSGSGQSGPKLVAYRWASCAIQAATTAKRTLADAAPNGGKVRFVAASNVGHAYNLNGMFSAVEAGAELCLPKDSKELAQTLLAAPADDCESTVLFATPRMYRSLLQEHEVASGNVLRALAAFGRPLHAFCAGCPLPEATARAAKERLGVQILQNYGSSETGNIALQELRQGPTADDGNGLNVGVPWGLVELRQPSEGRLLPPGAEGEICVKVDWASEGYVEDGELVPHSAAPFVRTGDAGRWADFGTLCQTLVVMQRLRSPLQVTRDGLRFLLQPYEVEAALLAADPSLTAAAALQGPGGELHCAVEGAGAGGGGPAMRGAVQPDRLLRMDALPSSPAGKILYSRLAELFVGTGRVA